MTRLYVPPFDTIDTTYPDMGMQMLPGRVALLSVPFNGRSGIHLIDKERYWPDAGTVCSSGVRGVDPGDVFVIVPGHGKFTSTDKDERELRLLGVVCPWWHSLIAKVSERGLAPAPGWTFVERDVRQSEIVLPREELLWTATVVGCNSDTPIAEGERVVFDPRDYEMYGFERPYPEGLTAIRPRHSQAASRGWLNGFDKVHEQGPK